MKALKAIWEVRAGLIPGESMPGYTQRFMYTSDDKEKDDALEDGRATPGSIYLQRRAEAHMHAQGLELGGLNWVTTDYMWI